MRLLTGAKAHQVGQAEVDVQLKENNMYLQPNRDC